MKTAVEQLYKDLELHFDIISSVMKNAAKGKQYYLDLERQQIKGAYKHGYMKGAYDVVYEKYDQEEDDNKANNYIQVIYERFKETDNE